MMLLLMLIMMLKFYVKESSSLIGLENFGAVTKSLLTHLHLSPPNVYILLLEVGD